MASREKGLKDVSVREVTVGELFERLVAAGTTVPKEAKLKDAVEAFLRGSGSQKVYVVGEGGVLLGTITFETLMRQTAYRLGTRPAGIVSFFRFLEEVGNDEVESFMAPPASVVKETRLLDAIQRMVEDRLNDLPVVDELGVLLGELRGLKILEEMQKLPE